MRSQALGKNISEVEVQGISSNGIWLYVMETEYFLPFDEYPWFKKAKLADIYNVEFLSGCHLQWPALDIDLELDSLERPEEYPLVYK